MWWPQDSGSPRHRVDNCPRVPEGQEPPRARPCPVHLTVSTARGTVLSSGTALSDVRVCFAAAVGWTDGQTDQAVTPVSRFTLSGRLSCTGQGRQALSWSSASAPTSHSVVGRGGHQDRWSLWCVCPGAECPAGCRPVRMRWGPSVSRAPCWRSKERTCGSTSPGAGRRSVATAPSALVSPSEHPHVACSGIIC